MSRFGLLRALKGRRGTSTCLGVCPRVCFHAGEGGGGEWSAPSGAAVSHGCSSTHLRRGRMFGPWSPRASEGASITADLDTHLHPHSSRGPPVLWRDSRFHKPSYNKHKQTRAPEGAAPTPAVVYVCDVKKPRWRPKQTAAHTDLCRQIFLISLQ